MTPPISSTYRPAAILLAAGVSSRMGRPKSALPFHGGTFLGHLVKTYKKLGVQPLIAVLSNKSQLENASLTEDDCLYNLRPDEGPLSSLKIALEKIPSTCPGYFIHPVDHPAVRFETLAELLLAWKGDPNRVVKPIFEGRGGHPVLLGSNWAEEMLQLPLTSTLRDLLRRHPDRIISLPVSDPGVLLNVNDYEQYEQLLKLYPET